MKSKKLSKIIIFSFIIIMFISLLGITNKSQAAGTLYLRIQETMTETGTGYAIGNPNASGATDATAMKLWNIVLSDAGYTSITEEDIYCIEAGQGFTNSSNARTDEYPNSFDLINQKAEIQANNILNGSITVDLDGNNVDVDVYSAILVLLDTMYLAYPNGYIENNTTDELVMKALEYARENGGQEEFQPYSSFLTNGNNELSQTDVLAVQQAAIWYFTNYEDSNGLYNQRIYNGAWKTSWLNTTVDDGVTYTAINDNMVNAQAEILYKYLIRTAIEKADNYESSRPSTSSPISVSTDKLDQTISDDKSNYILGPFEIYGDESMGLDLEILVFDNGTDIGYKLVDDLGNEISKDKILNNELYIQISVADVTNIADLEVSINTNHMVSSATVWTDEADLNNTQPVIIPNRETYPNSIILKADLEFDLALRKYITHVNGTELTGSFSRVPNIDTNILATDTTAIYSHKKDPVLIETGDIVTYNLTIYNEGEKAGRATKVVDQLPTGLRFVDVISGNFIEDPANPYNETTNTLNLIRDAANTDNLAAYTGTTLDSETITITCEVVATPSSTENTILTNVAWISEEFDAVDNTTILDQTGLDRDSQPGNEPNVNKDNMEDYKGNISNKDDLADNGYFYEGQQDDDDFEKLVLAPQTFDLKLIKRITQVNNQNVPERIIDVDVSNLNVVKPDGTFETTGIYELDKEPVSVAQGDIVTYTFRIYNEGTIDGYASEITEDIPEGLEFIWSDKTGQELVDDTTFTDEEKEAIEFNQTFLWGNFQYDSNGKIIEVSTDYLSKDQEARPGDNLIPAFGTNDGSKDDTDISYKEVSIKMKVVAENLSGNVITNAAAITEDTDEDGNIVDDRDSDTEEWTKTEEDEDDEDIDNIVLQSFDLALRKFITAVSEDETIEEEEYLKNEDGTYSRAPVVDTSKLNTTDADGNMITTAEYNHTKEPLMVKHDDIVIYTLRVYNEGEADGYAGEITDYLPPYLEYVDGEFNDNYGWTLEADGRTVKTRYLDDTLLEGAKVNNSGTIVLSYEEVQIMCKVIPSAPTDENITNLAEITEYLDKDKDEAIDRDSESDNVDVPTDEDLPGYKEDEEGTYIPGQEDDDDFEKVIIKIFDLALRKWVTQAIVYDENGDVVITETGHQPYDDPEPIVKVDLDKNDLDKVVVKFRYSIRIINEGDVAGYATEITDYVPEGLVFLPEDNTGWVDEGNNIISTRLLENTLLQPGEFADVEVVLTWINGEDNLDLKVNTAEISEDDNEYDLEDEDSTPDNKKPGEDDIDDAPVILTIITGQAPMYIGLVIGILSTMTIGVILIKRYVL